MLDVHPPNSVVHTWKDFFIHIATIVVGLLIAVGLEQTVEYFHHRHQVAEARTALMLERKSNANRFGLITDEFFRFVPKLKANLAIFEYLRRHPDAPPGELPGKLDWLAIRSGFADAAWRTATESGVREHMPRAEVKRNSELYRRLQLLQDRLDAEYFALNEARRFAISDPDASLLSPAQLDRQADLTREVLLQYALAAREQKNLSNEYPDFKPAPSRQDVYGILHATTDPADQSAIDTLQRKWLQSEAEDDAERSSGSSPVDTAAVGEHR